MAALEVDRRLDKLALGYVEDQPSILEAFEDLLKVLNVNRQIRAGDQNVVNVDTDNGMPAMTMSIRIGTAEQWIGTCRYLFLRSSLEKMLQPSLCPVKSPMLGTGYSSAEVTRFSRRKLLQGRHELSFFLKRWRGDDQALLEDLTMPATSQLLKIFLAAARLSASRGRKPAMTGSLVVLR